VDSLYRNDDNIDPEIKEKFFGWRKYRIDLDRVMPQILRDSGLDPSLRKIGALRIWFEDGPGNTSIFQRDLQLFGLRLTRNQWTDLGVFAVDSTEVPAA